MQSPDSDYSGFDIDRLSRRGLLKAGGAGLLMGAAAPFLAACGGSSSTSAAGSKPVIGGMLRLGCTGGAPSDKLDPYLANTTPNQVMLPMLHDPFVRYDRDAQVAHVLADELVPNADASKWTLRVKRGIEFHNGHELTADDLLFTFAHGFNPKLASFYSIPLLSFLDLTSIRKVDRYTVTLKFVKPCAILGDYLAANPAVPLPTGFNPTKPIGTGPFKYKTSAPGTQYQYDKNPNYWQPGRPYLDSVIFTDFQDETGEINALLGGQSDAVGLLTAQGSTQLNSSTKPVIVSKTGGFNTLGMRVDVPPFNDVRVRQALRLLVDREEINNQVFAGKGTICTNDVFGLYDPSYATSGLPARTRDVEKAKHLLKAAGVSQLPPFTTAPVDDGSVAMAEVFVQQLNSAGIKTKLNSLSVEAFLANFTKWPFGVDFFSSFSYLWTVGLGTLSTAPSNDTHFADRAYDALYYRAVGTIDPAKRAALVHQMMRIDYERGGYIIPVFMPVIDGHSPSVHGFEPSRAGLPLNGGYIADVWKAA